MFQWEKYRSWLIFFFVMAILLRTVIKKKIHHQLVLLHIITGLNFKSHLFNRVYKTLSLYYYATEVVSASSNICYTTKREAVLRGKPNSFTDKQLSNTERIFLIASWKIPYIKFNTQPVWPPRKQQASQFCCSPMYASLSLA